MDTGRSATSGGSKSKQARKSNSSTTRERTSRPTSDHRQPTYHASARAELKKSKQRRKSNTSPTPRDPSPPSDHRSISRGRSESPIRESISRSRRSSDSRPNDEARKSNSNCPPSYDHRQCARPISVPGLIHSESYSRELSIIRSRRQSDSRPNDEARKSNSWRPSYHRAKAGPGGNDPGPEKKGKKPVRNSSSSSDDGEWLKQLKKDIEALLDDMKKLPIKTVADRLKKPPAHGN